MASTDVCEICGGLRNLRTSPQVAERRPWRISTDFCGFRRSPADLGGILRSPSVFRWVCADACPTSVRGILFFKWSGCLTICELCCVPTSCPVYCWALPLPVSPHPQKSTSKICKLLPVVTSNVKKTKASNTKNGVSQNRGFPVPDIRGFEKRLANRGGWRKEIPSIPYFGRCWSPTPSRQPLFETSDLNDYQHWIYLGVLFHGPFLATFSVI